VTWTEGRKKGRRSDGRRKKNQDLEYEPNSEVGVEEPSRW